MPVLRDDDMREALCEPVDDRYDRIAPGYGQRAAGTEIALRVGHDQHIAFTGTLAGRIVHRVSPTEPVPADRPCCRHSAAPARVARAAMERRDRRSRPLRDQHRRRHRQRCPDHAADHDCESMLPRRAASASASVSPPVLSSLILTALYLPASRSISPSGQASSAQIGIGCGTDASASSSPAAAAARSAPRRIRPAPA